MPETATPPTAPATAPAAAPATAPASEPAFNRPFADIEDLFKEPEPPPTQETPDKEEPSLQTPKPGEKGVAKPVSQPPKDKTAPPEKPGAKPIIEASGPKELRSAYEKSKARVKELEAQIEAARTSRPAEDPEKKSLGEQIETLRKRADDLEKELQTTAYERSEDFKTRYAAPLEAAYKEAFNTFSKLKVTDSEGNQTTAGAGHLNALLRMEPDEQAEYIDRVFGQGAAALLAAKAVSKVKDLFEAQKLAVETHQKTATEAERQRQEQFTKQIEARRNAFKQHVQEGIESHPKLFKADDDDPKGKELLTKGMQLADLGFSGGNGIVPDELVKVHAAIRNKAGGYDYVVYQWRKAADRIKELETQLAEYQKSEPGEGEGRRPAGGKDATWEDEIDALARES